MTTIPHLYTTRKEVEIYNTSVFNKAKPENKVSIAAIDWVIGSSNPTIQTKVLQRIPDDSSKSMGSLLRLVKNVCADNYVDVQDGLTNGAACIFKHFDYRVEGSDRCSIIWVQFSEPTIGKTLLGCTH